MGQQTSLSLTAWFVGAGVFASSCLLPPERLGLAEQGDDDGSVADVTLDDAARSDAASAEDGEPSIDGAEVPDGAQMPECAGDDDCAADAYCDSEGTCAAGCRVEPDNCPDDQVCDARTRACSDPACGMDTDSDGTPNCNDPCPNDAARSALNACGACAALPAEVCDGADNDCDGVTDNAGANLCAAGEACVHGVCIPPGYVRIAPGVFTMGSPAGELGRSVEEVQHQVTITRAFLMKTTEVTQAEWQAVMGSNPSYFAAGGGGAACGANCPVETVSWNDAVDYVNRLSDATGLERCYDANRAFAGLGCLGYRLPTEAEREYAARAGTQTAYHTGVNTQTECNNDPNLNLAGWYCGNAANTTHPVGQKQVNEWGLYDMHGNVAEWVQDWYAAYPTSAAVDPVGAAAGSSRALRGGAWNYYAQNVRSANRNYGTPEERYCEVGLRPARSLP